MKKRSLLLIGILTTGLLIGVLLFCINAQIIGRPTVWQHYTLSDPQLTPCAPPEDRYFYTEDYDFYELSVLLTNDGRSHITYSSFLPGHFETPSGEKSLVFWQRLAGEEKENPLSLQAFFPDVPAGQSRRIVTVLIAFKEVPSCVLRYDPYDFFADDGNASLPIEIF